MLTPGPSDRRPADIPAALLTFARAHNATQLVLGATPRTWRAALRPAASIRSRVIRRGGGLDVHIVTCQRRPGPMQGACSGHGLVGNVKSC